MELPFFSDGCGEESLLLSFCLTSSADGSITLSWLDFFLPAAAGLGTASGGGGGTNSCLGCCFDFAAFELAARKEGG